MKGSDSDENVGRTIFLMNNEVGIRKEQYISLRSGEYEDSDGQAILVMGKTIE